MKKYKLILSLLVVLFWCFNAYPATQTINTLPSSNATFISDNAIFLGNEQANREALQANSTDIKVISGGIGATDASLTHTISEITAFPNGFYVNDAAISHTYTASKRTFVYVRDSDSRTITIAGAAITYDGNFVFAETVASTAYPGTPTGTLPLFYADTNGTAITSITDLRGDFVNGSNYYPNFWEADQGITGNNNTIKYYVDLAGSDNATIVLRHNSGNATTTYTLTTSETIPANITIKLESGAILDGAGTLTFAVGAGFESGDTQAFGTSITVAGLVTGKALWWGFDTTASAAVNDAAIASALAACQNVVETRGGTFNTSASITFDRVDHQTLTLSPSTFISYSGTGFAVIFEGVNRCRLNGYGRLITTDASGSGVKFLPTSTLQCRNNAIEFHLILGKGGPSSAAYAASGTAGIFFNRVIGSGGAYFNYGYVDRISGYNTNVVFDAPGGNPANGPSGSRMINTDHEDYWFGHRFEGAECMVYGGFANSSAGDAVNNTTFLHFSNGALYNEIVGVVGEPGSFAIPYSLASGCNNNTIRGNFSNFSLAGTDAGTENFIQTGRNFYLPHITFPATQVPIANVNTLDDYQEGSATITLEFGGASTGITYDNQTLYYTKVGNKVSVTGYLNLSSKGSASGDAVIQGLPFNCKNNPNATTAAAIQFELISFADAPSALVLFNTDELRLYETSNAGTRTTITDANFANDSRLYFSATYFTD